jgi:hypothetical protein
MFSSCFFLIEPRAIAANSTPIIALFSSCFYTKNGVEKGQARAKVSEQTGNQQTCEVGGVWLDFFGEFEATYLNVCLK